MNEPIRVDIDADQIGEITDRLDAMSAAIRPEVIDELVALRSSAKMAAETYSEAIAAQSEITGIRKGALRRFVNAKEADKLGDLDMESTDLAKLMDITGDAQ
jgi:hypothetical protein